MMPLQPTGKSLYDEVWAVARQQLKKTSNYIQDKGNLWWESRNLKVTLRNISQKKDVQFKPFVLKTVDRNGYNCSQCHWKAMCSGCIVLPTDEVIPDFFKKIHLAIEWHS